MMMKINPSTLLLLVSILGLAQLHVSEAQNEPKDFLDPQNAARAEVGVEPLTWDTTLEEYAKKYAMVRSKDCELIHSNGPYGENIYWGEGDEGWTDAAAAVKYWVDEKAEYDYNNNSCINGADCLHYTQIVWKNSVHVGCARSKCSYDKFFITCNYDPPGNFHSQRPY